VTSTEQKLNKVKKVLLEDKVLQILNPQINFVVILRKINKK